MDYHNIEILFVEDSADDAVLTIRALKKAGITNKLHHVINGAEALDFLYCQGVFSSRNPQEFPKLILLDVKMPKISGVQVLEKIKTDPNLKSIPVVMLTSSNEGPDIEKCFKLGANSYIVKPVDSDKFFSAVKEIGIYWLALNQPAH